MTEVFKSNESFNYKNLDELQFDIEKNNLDIKISKNLGVLSDKVKVGKFTLENRFLTHPMEGGDAIDGKPTDLTFRKYENMARGGAGLIWLEAVSISREGHSNDGQLWIKEDTIPEFKELNDLIKNSAKDEFGENFNNVTIVQLNHSGRYCKKNGKRTPIIATHKKPLDDKIGIDENYEVVTDEYIDELIEKFVIGARLSKKAGFDGVDIKACHGYLLGEMLSGYNREGKYGGSFENRIKVIREIVRRIKNDEECNGLLISARLNVYDKMEYPHGFGVNSNNEVSFEEAKKMIEILHEDGVELFSLTMGNPYFIPHVNKPYDIGTYIPPERAIEGCNRLISGIGEIQKAFPNIPICGVGFSWFRQFAPFVSAGAIENNMCTLVGFGRESIAYPDFAKDIINKGEMDKSKVCISCSKCSIMKSKIGKCGCVIRDNEVYVPIYKDMEEGKL